MQARETRNPAESATDVQRQPLDPIFSPRTVAVIGATEREQSVGRMLLSNLLASSTVIKVFPVNPHRRTILGQPAWPCVSALPEPVDLAVIVTPAQSVPSVIEECVRVGIPAGIVISAGFREAGELGCKLEESIRRIAHGKMRIIGPNCLGVMNPVTGLNATFGGAMALRGNVAFISQSGALCTAILDWSQKRGIGFSAFVSTGSMLDVGWGDLIYHFGDDPHTQSILIYMESIGDARAFMSAAREVAFTKPIIVIKAGRTAAAAKAAASHTGALTGSDDVLDAAFRRCGVLRVDSIEELFYMTELLGKQPLPRGPRLAILTNAGGPAVLATDALVGAGGKLAELDPALFEGLKGMLPPHWSHGNPIDVLGDADPERYARAFEAVAEDEGIDGLLLILTPQAMTDPSGFARRLAQSKRPAGKPILASWMGGASIEEADRILGAAGIPTFPYPDVAAKMFHFMWQHSVNYSRLYETPELVSAKPESCEAAGRIIRAARDGKRTLLSEIESKQLLAAYGIPVLETRLAQSEDEAVEHASDLGFPVAAKLHSHTVTHKTDVNGVQLDLRSADDVRRAWCLIKNGVATAKGAEHFLGITLQPMCRASDGYELILGSSTDPQFGPVLAFGMGGQLVEVLKDVALALPPLTSTLAHQLLESTRIHRALMGVRGRKPVDLKTLIDTLVRFSQLVVELPEVREIEINPLLASPVRVVALDARVVLHGPEETNRPRPAIRPYPRHYSWIGATKDGRALALRPIRPEDEPLMVRFQQQLSDRTVCLRYLYNLRLDQRIAHERLMRICFIDYDREMALVAERQGAHDREIVGVGRLSKLHGRNTARLYLLVADPVQGQGVGLQLMQQLLNVARQERLERVIAHVPVQAEPMLHLCHKFGFRTDRISPEIVCAELELQVHK